MAYSDKVLDHYENPRNVGSFAKDDDAVGTGMHAAGLSRASGYSVGRFAGIALTWAVLIVLAVWNIVAFLRPALA